MRCKARQELCRSNRLLHHDALPRLSDRLLRRDGLPHVRAGKLFRFRTCEKCFRKPSGIRSYKIVELKVS